MNHYLYYKVSFLSCSGKENIFISRLEECPQDSGNTILTMANVVKRPSWSIYLSEKLLLPDVTQIIHERHKVGLMESMNVALKLLV